MEGFQQVTAALTPTNTDVVILGGNMRRTALVFPPHQAGTYSISFGQAQLTRFYGIAIPQNSQPMRFDRALIGDALTCEVHALSIVAAVSQIVVLEYYHL